MVPGSKLLYSGKVVDIKREVKGGWTIGTATLEPFDDDEEGSEQLLETRQLVLSYQVNPQVSFIGCGLTWGRTSFTVPFFKTRQGKLLRICSVLRPT